MKKQLLNSRVILSTFLIMLFSISIFSCGNENYVKTPQTTVKDHEKEAFDQLATNLKNISEEFNKGVQVSNEETGRGFFSFIGKLIGIVVADASSTITSLFDGYGLKESLAVGAHSSWKKEGRIKIYFSNSRGSQPLRWDLTNKEELLKKMDSLLLFDINAINDANGNLTNCVGNWHNAIIICAMKNGPLSPENDEEGIARMELSYPIINSYLKDECKLPLFHKERVQSISNSYFTIYEDENSDEDYLSVCNRIASLDNQLGYEMRLLRDCYYNEISQFQTVEDVKGLTIRFASTIKESEINEDSKERLLIHLSIAENSYELWYTLFKHIYKDK